jgi:hypothetical protein
MAGEAPTLVEEPPARATAAPVKAPDASAPAAGKDKKAPKDKKEKKPKKGAKAPGGAEGGDAGPSVAAHPRAARGVARAKSWGGLAGFLIAGYMSLPTAPLLDAGLRALLAGVVCYVVAWAGAVFAWRRLVMIEIKAREQQLITAAQAAAGQREPQAARIPEPARARAAS